MGLGAKRCYCPQPRSSPARRKEGASCRDSQGCQLTNLPIGLQGSVEWPLTPLLRGSLATQVQLPCQRGLGPFLSLGLCQSPGIPETDGTDCEVRVEFIELSLGCFFIVIAKLPRLAFAWRAL